MSNRIFHVIDSLGIGGGQSMLFELHQSLARCFPDWVQSVHLVKDKTPADTFIKSYGIEFEKTNLTDLYPMILSATGRKVVLYHKLMASKLQDLKPIFGKVPTICINHTHTSNYVFNRFKYADHVVAVCNYMRDNICRLGCRIPVTVIYNSVNSNRFENIPAGDRGYGDEVLLTGRINALNAIKYSEDWVRWCGTVDLPKPLIHEYMGPSSKAKDALRVANEVSQKKNKVLMLGSVSNFQQKISIIKRWDFFLYEINRHEGLSMALLEALACGVPVICSNHYGNKEIIQDGVNGMVFKNRMEAMSMLTEFCLNPDLIVKLKESTRRHFRDHLEAKVMGTKYGELINGLIDGTLPKKPVGPMSVIANRPRPDLKKRPKLKRPQIVPLNRKRLKPPVSIQSIVKPKRP